MCILFELSLKGLSSHLAIHSFSVTTARHDASRISLKHYRIVKAFRTARDIACTPALIEGSGTGAKNGE